ncbi:MAG: hypothetical protein H6Q89_4928, partial [Myxococcaceae bacterium]|nr:hypothetical protein [Myxococcaceae bacterium]
MSLKLYVRCLVAICALVPGGAFAQPLLELDNGTADFGVTLGADSRLRGTATLKGPTLRVSTGGKDKAEKKPGRSSGGFPMQVERLVVHDGVIVFSSASQGRELIRIHGLELTVENYSNRRSASGQTLITASGKVGKGGQLELSVKADPGTSNFSGHAEVVGLGLSELGTLVDKRFAVPLLTGQFTLQLDFAVRDGQITGTARPSLAGVGIGPGEASGILGGLTAQLPQEVLDAIPGGLGGQAG